jgi:hypothetical protein
MCRFVAIGVLLLLLLSLVTPQLLALEAQHQSTQHSSHRASSCKLANNLNHSRNKGFNLSGFMLAQHLIITNNTTISTFEIDLNVYSHMELEWAQVWAQHSNNSLPDLVIGSTAFDTSQPTIPYNSHQGLFYTWSLFMLPSGGYWLVMKPAYLANSWVMATNMKAPLTPNKGQTVAMDMLAFFVLDDGLWISLE